MNEKDKEILAAIITTAIGLGAVVIQYAATSRTVQIEARAKWESIKSWFNEIRNAERVGERFAEWFIREESSAVIERAEEITKEGAE